MRCLQASRLFSRFNNHFRHVSYMTKTKPLENAKSRFCLTENFSVGAKIHGFTVRQVQDVPDLLLKAVRLTHDKTGADYIHVARDDSNNTFNIAFRTTPMDSTGVSHILEHTVLCGSKKYPVRDPFFKMLNRSLATYMNALTGLDYTMYPFATQNPKDFKNLMNVYLDAVFDPYLREMDFRQEGWRLENENLTDPNSPLVYKGIVFNEMKGVFANTEDVFTQRLLNNLLPSHTYAHVSGGEPLKILDLTWEQLKHFHATHYHPSNARIFSYGNFPLEDHLQTINEKLDSFSRIETNTSIPLEKRWNGSRKLEISCRVDPLLPNSEKNATVAVSYLLGCTSNVQETVTLQILSHLLTSEPNSPFYKALLEPNIGANYSPFTGYSAQTREGMFSIGLQGIHPNDANKVCNIIDKTFEETIENGFDRKDIEAILHNIELGNKLVTANFGLHLSMFIMPTWNHEGDVIELLRVNEINRKFRQNLADNPKFLQDVVAKYFKNNPHRLTLIMKPDPTYENNLVNEEKEKLIKMTSRLTTDEKTQIYNFGLELKAKQEKEEDISCLPTLKINDIEKEIPFTQLNHRKIANQPVQITIQPTNGVTHFRGLFSTAHLPNNLRSLVPLFCNVATKMGAGDMDYKLLSQEIDLKTGGLNVSTNVSENVIKFNGFEQGIHFYSHCLDRNTDDMFHLWRLIFNSIDFSNADRLSTLIQMEAMDLVSRISDVGSAYALNSASSVLTRACALKNQFSGMKLVAEMRRIAEKSDLTDVITSLREIASTVLIADNCRFSVNTTADAIPPADRQLEKLLKSLKTPNLALKPTEVEIEAHTRRHFLLPFPVNYVGKCILGVPFTHTDFAPLSITAEVMTNKFLHREIREKGGAYGGRAAFHTSGVFSLYSYRDPNNLKTLETFDKAIEWVQKGEFNQQDIDEAKLAVFQHVDKPVSPGDKGSRLFLSGITDQQFQTYRQRLLDVSKDDLIRVTSLYLANPIKTGICILGPECSSIKNDPNWVISTD